MIRTCPLLFLLALHCGPSPTAKTAPSTSPIAASSGAPASSPTGPAPADGPPALCADLPVTKTAFGEVPDALVALAGGSFEVTRTWLTWVTVPSPSNTVGREWGGLDIKHFPADDPQSVARSRLASLAGTAPTADLSTSWTDHGRALTAHVVVTNVRVGDDGLVAGITQSTKLTALTELHLACVDATPPGPVSFAELTRDRLVPSWTDAPVVATLSGAKVQIVTIDRTWNKPADEWTLWVDEDPRLAKAVIDAAVHAGYARSKWAYEGYDLYERPIGGGMKLEVSVMKAKDSLQIVFARVQA